jgi:putative ABC transport system permease protein
VVLISNTMARSYWPNDDPIGKRIQIGFFKDSPREVVGIVGDVQQAVRQTVQRPQMYVPYAQLPLNQQGQGYRIVNFVVRSNISTAEGIPAMRSVVAEVDRTLAMYDIQTVEDYASNQTLGDRIYLTLLGAFGGIAVLLAIVGVYGIMAHSVNQRTNEIGIRVALGAGSWNVLALVLRHGLILVLIGLIIGVGASFALTRVIQRFLWQVKATDPQTFVLALLALAGIAFLACYIPARRTLKVDPVVALRSE